jgi:hypothetical protein
MLQELRAKLSLADHYGIEHPEVMPDFGFRVYKRKMRIKCREDSRTPRPGGHTTTPPLGGSNSLVVPLRGPMGGMLGPRGTGWQVQSSEQGRVAVFRDNLPVWGAASSPELLAAVLREAGFAVTRSWPAAGPESRLTTALARPPMA